MASPASARDARTATSVLSGCQREGFVLMMFGTEGGKGASVAVLSGDALVHGSSVFLSAVYADGDV